MEKATSKYLNQPLRSLEQAQLDITSETFQLRLRETEALKGKKDDNKNQC